MSSKAVIRLKQEGYQTTGIILQAWKHDKAEAVEKAKALQVMGNSVKVVMDTEVTHFRDSKSVDRYWVVLAKYSEAYLEFKKAEREAHEKERRQMALRRMADELTLEEMAWMMKDKVDRMSTKELRTE